MAVDIFSRQPSISNSLFASTGAYDTTRSGNQQTDINNLYGAASEARGYMGPHTARAGSPSIALMEEAARLEQQRDYDPWGYYRPAAAKSLAGQMGRKDPSNAFRQQLATMLGQQPQEGEDPAVEWRDKLTAMMSGEFNPDDPSFKFRFEQGQKAAERSLAARGLLNSGNAAAELQAYGQSLASTEYGNQFERVLQGMTGVENQFNTQQNRLQANYGDQYNRVLQGMLGTEQQYDAQQRRLMDLAGVGVGPGVLSNQSLGMFSQVSKNNYLNQESAGIQAGLGGNNNDPYAGYRFG